MKTKVLFALISIVIVSCAPADKKAQLDSLKQQMAEIEEQISNLENELAASGEAPVVATKKYKPVKISEVNYSFFKHFIEVQGSLISEQDINVSAMANGEVEKVYVDKGQRVRKGQVLAKIDGAILEKSIEELKTGLELARTMFERTERLWKQSIGSEVQYLQAKNQKESLEKKLETLKEQYSLYQITAPITGEINGVFLKEGQLAGAGAPAFQIVGIKDMKIEANLSEKYITNIHLDDPVKAYIPTIDMDLNLKIDASSNAIDPKNRTFKVEIEVPDNEKIKPNMLTILTINDYSNDSALVVPINSVQRSADSEFIFVAKKSGEDWKAVKKTVKTGEYDKKHVEILEGINAGDRIVTYGYQNLADGELLKIEK